MNKILGTENCAIVSGIDKATISAMLRQIEFLFSLKFVMNLLLMSRDLLHQVRSNSPRITPIRRIVTDFHRNIRASFLKKSAKFGCLRVISGES